MRADCQNNTWIGRNTGRKKSIISLHGNTPMVNSRCKKYRENRVNKLWPNEMSIATIWLESLFTIIPKPCPTSPRHCSHAMEDESAQPTTTSMDDDTIMKVLMNETVSHYSFYRYFLSRKTYRVRLVHLTELQETCKSLNNIRIIQHLEFSESHRRGVRTKPQKFYWNIASQRICKANNIETHSVEKFIVLFRNRKQWKYPELGKKVFELNFNQKHFFVAFSIT